MKVRKLFLLFLVVLMTAVVCVPSVSRTAKAGTTPGTVTLKITPASSGLKVSWNKADNANGYEVWRKMSTDSRYSRLMVTNSLSYLDTQTADGKTYRYKVRSFYSAGSGQYEFGEFSEVASYVKVGTPKITAIANTSGGIKITWDKATQASAYQIYRKVSGESSYTKIKSVGKSVTSFTDTTAPIGKTSSYKVRAYYKSSSGNIYYGYYSAVSNMKRLGVTRVYLSTDVAQVIVKWHRISGVTAYQVYRKAEGETSYKKIASTTGRSYTDKTTQNGKMYSYKVRGYYKGDSATYMGAFGAVNSIDGCAASTSSTYALYVNCKANVITVYTKDSSGNYTVPYKAMVCSTGTATPRGTYYTYDDPSNTRWNPSKPWWPLYGGVYGMYAYGIVDDILFHSVPYYAPDQTRLEWEEYNKLGTAASMGCVRLAVKDVMWIFSHCPHGTKVVFYEDSNPGPLGKPTPIHIESSSPNKGWDPTDPSPDNPWNN
ncbi:MAG: L,D-transpeptidase family protein [Erysipelotrichales bacterium]|nr:L,D-transpeptidase family protein [Erysipelotrichales bacterium]